MVLETGYRDSNHFEKTAVGASGLLLFLPDKALKVIKEGAARNKITGLKFGKTRTAGSVSEMPQVTCRKILPFNCH